MFNCKGQIYELLSAGSTKITNTKIKGLPLIYSYARSKIEIDGCKINSGLIGNALSDGSRCVIRTLADNALISLKNVGVSGAVIVARKKIIVGSGTLIGEGCLIIDSDHHYLGSDPNISRNDPKYIKSKGINIGKNVFIGARSIILKGVTIPDGTIIGAGSIIRN